MNQTTSDRYSDTYSYNNENVKEIFIAEIKTG